MISFEGTIRKTSFFQGPMHLKQLAQAVHAAHFKNLQTRFEGGLGHVNRGKEEFKSYFRRQRQRIAIASKLF